MVNLYKLLNALEQGMTLFQLDKWNFAAGFVPFFTYGGQTNEIEVVTNLFLPTPPPEGYHIQLTGNYDEDEHAEWQQFLDENQWKIYPLLANIIRVFLPNPEGVSYQLLYTQYPQGFISVIAKPYKTIQS